MTRPWLVIFLLLSDYWCWGVRKPSSETKSKKLSVYWNMNFSYFFWVCVCVWERVGDRCSRAQIDEAKPTWNPQGEILYQTGEVIPRIAKQKKHRHMWFGLGIHHRLNMKLVIVKQKHIGDSDKKTSKVINTICLHFSFKHRWSTIARS